ncbi:hypothetical protein HPP92_017993 [Vanilla planifolia]|uniref:Aspartate/ornithine carbamoyltransferase Asp/Orn-binding domain-containing protein n=1 Tax=Vanilla planifolia TaxID=51239 RepID=A0A835Q8Z4_VANPL|nr:hypothetical protein HPP92_017993 [Vanilla planifolia]
MEFGPPANIGLDLPRDLSSISSFSCWIGKALLDVYTIGREVGQLDGIKLGLVGDLANGRTDQRERFGERIDLYEAARGKYIVDRESFGCDAKACGCHAPLPRLDEITVDVDADPRAAYFRQAKNGLYIRMALFKTAASGRLNIGENFTNIANE